MYIDTEIPTPDSCVDCKFHLIETDGRYGKWIMRCMILNTIKMDVNEGLKARSPDCPGVVVNEEKKE